MIVVKVELHSANSGKVSELARVMIHNVGCSPDGKKGDYKVEQYKGRSQEALEKAMRGRNIFRHGEVLNHSRLSLHVWHLVAKALASLGYGGK